MDKEKNETAPQGAPPHAVQRPAPPPPPPPPLPAQDQRVPALAAEVATLRKELAELRARPPSPDLPPPPPGTGEEFAFRLGRLERVVEEVRSGAAARDGAVELWLSKSVSREDFKDLSLQVSDLAYILDTLKSSFSREKELDARLLAAENSVKEMKTSVNGARAERKLEMGTMAHKDELDALNVRVSSSQASLDDVKLSLSQYAGELTAVERECGRMLGEAQGMLKAAAQDSGPRQFDEHLREVVSRLNAKLAEVETAMHAGLTELSGRLNAGEVLYRKIFADAEERLAKSIEPKLGNIEGQLRWLRENLLRLSDDYAVVTERKVRALEAKYSAFEAISRRMDAIDAALKKGGRLGLP